MPTYHLTWRQRFPVEIRADFVVVAGNRQEAKTIAESQAAKLGASYRFLGASE